MKNKLKEFFKFTSSSLASTVVDLGIFALLVWLLKESAPTYYILIATVIARIISLLVNYFINAKLVFEEEKNNRRSAFIKYISLAIFDMLASALLVTLITRHLIPNETFNKMVVDSSLFFVGYAIQRKFIF